MAFALDTHFSLHALKCVARSPCCAWGKRKTPAGQRTKSSLRRNGVCRWPFRSGKPPRPARSAWVRQNKRAPAGASALRDAVLPRGDQLQPEVLPQFEHL